MRLDRMFFSHMCGTHSVILLLVVSDYVSKLWRCLEDYWEQCFALANNTGGPVQEIARLAFRCVVRVRTWWFGSKWRLCNKAFYHRPGKGKILETVCSVSSLDVWTYFKPWSQRERVCRLSQFSRQVQDSQCSPLASACEGKYRYCFAPCYCLTMSEALRKLSLQVQRTPCETGSMFSQRVTTCLKLLVSVLVLRWAHWTGGSGTTSIAS